MNNTITLPQVITRLAKLTNTDSNTARLFLRAFFATIEKNLAAGETVVIKNVGTFKRSEDPTFGSAEGVIFVPDKAIMDEINAPFAMFSAVELAADLTEEELAPETEELEAEMPAETPVAELDPESQPEPHPESQPEPQSEPQPEPEPHPETGATTAEPQETLPVSEPAAEPQPISRPIVPEHQPVAPAPAPVPAPQIAEVPTPKMIEEEDEVIATEPRKKSRVWLWAVLLVIAAIAGGYFAAVYAVPDFNWDDEESAVPVEEEITNIEPLPEIDVDQAAIVARESEGKTAPVNSEPMAEITPATAAVTESAKAAPAPGTEPRYDTVTSTRFLATMAKEYYGRNIYWVYIYEANKDHLGDPNKVSAGTRVRIPDKSEFPQASSPEEAVKMATKKAAEIQARFGR